MIRLLIHNQYILINRYKNNCYYIDFYMLTAIGKILIMVSVNSMMIQI